MNVSTALTVQERASVALGAAEHEKKLIELVKHAEGVIAITSPATYSECHGARMSLKNARVSIEKAGKSAREDAAAYVKAVIGEQKRLIAIGEPQEFRLEEMEAAHNERIDREKAAREQAERDRVEHIQAAIADLRAIPLKAVGKPSLVISELAHDLETQWATDLPHYAEFAGEAEAAKVESAKKLAELLATAREHEAALEQARKDREELARRRAEEDERLRQAAEREAAEIRARAEADAKRRAEIEAEERAARQRIEAQEAVAREARDKADREASARLAAQEAESKRIRDAEDKRLQDERERLAAEARALEEQQRLARSEQEAKERAEREANELAERTAREQARQEQETQEAEAREIRRKVHDLVDARDILVTFRQRYHEISEFADVISAIDQYFAGQDTESETDKDRAAAL